MSHWRDYRHSHPANTVVGTLLVNEGIHSPQLNNQRPVLVWLPQSYEQSDKRYPVLYMHDGQNLFDAYTSYAGEWSVDETMILLEDEGIEAIIVGLPNNDRRLFEYSPYPEPRLQVKKGEGDAYLTWISTTVKPIIDHDFRTLPDRDHTGLAGSSMGGLITLYGFLCYAEVFGCAAVFSPSYWFGQRSIFKTVEDTPYRGGRLYLDIGMEEGYTQRRRSDQPNQYALAVRQLGEMLLAKGYQHGENFAYMEDEQGRHNEEAWARRLPNALRFLLRR
jgi:predicted alpha/beta superfamily hydrolase